MASKSELEQRFLDELEKFQDGCPSAAEAAIPGWVPITDGHPLYEAWRAYHHAPGEPTPQPIRNVWGELVRRSRKPLTDDLATDLEELAADLQSEIETKGTIASRDA